MQNLTVEKVAGPQDLSFLALEITGKCQLQCGHCYADSGPQRDHGDMQAQDWRRVIDEASELGVTMVQFIGGEPTLHPALGELIDHALDRGMTVEVFSNLVKVSPKLWERFTREGGQLASSYYSTDDAWHERLTRGVGSRPRTRASIEEAVRRGVPIRVGVIAIDDQQDVDDALPTYRGLAWSRSTLMICAVLVVVNDWGRLSVGALALTRCAGNAGRVWRLWDLMDLCAPAKCRNG